MLKKSNTTLLISGLTSIAITILLYLLTFDYIFNIPIRWISLCFLILSEVIGTFKALKIKKSIFGVSSIITSIIHIFVVLILSILFILGWVFAFVIFGFLIEIILNKFK